MNSFFFIFAIPQSLLCSLITLWDHICRRGSNSGVPRVYKASAWPVVLSFQPLKPSLKNGINLIWVSQFFLGLSSRSTEHVASISVLLKAWCVDQQSHWGVGKRGMILDPIPCTRLSMLGNGPALCFKNLPTLSGAHSYSSLRTSIIGWLQGLEEIFPTYTLHLSNLSPLAIHLNFYQTVTFLWHKVMDLRCIIPMSTLSCCQLNFSINASYFSDLLQKK